MSTQPVLPRVGLIGAGYISAVHAEALSALKYSVSAIIDPNIAAAEVLARQFNVPSVFGSVEEGLAAGAFDRAHVLVPPDRHHSVALACLQAGKPVLIEKPICVTDAECASLVEAASSASVPAGVNQNFVYHPAFLRLTRDVRSRAYGRTRYVSVVYHAALRQLATRQFSHWMFREPRNLLLEQAVHPLSQLLAICGVFGETKAIGETAVGIAPNVSFVPGFTASITCGSVPASVRFSVGHAFPYWQIEVVCDDGVLVADILANRYTMRSRTRWLEPVDMFLSGHRTALSIAAESRKNLVGYGLSMLKLMPRSDAFFQSMQNSVAAFHRALDAHAPIPLDATFGRTVIEACDQIWSQILPAEPAHPAPALNKQPPSSPDVAVLGGTGFIGTEVVRRLREAGLTLSVLARNTVNLPQPFQEGGVTLHRGDVRSSDDVSLAIAGARYVVNLAHGGGGATWEAIRDGMVGSAETVARACLGAGTERLVHIGSIAALYLGPQPLRVTGATPPDPKFPLRADYARAKAMADLRLQEMHRDQNLPVCILRPGLVVGEGTSPFHSGLGFFNNEQHCIGWNEGRNPLPFVLVEDVANAIYLALQAQDVEGRSYNLVGGVRPSARDYLIELSRVLERPLYFHPKSPYALYSNEIGKWMIKRAAGRRVPPPSLRDLISRGLKAEFDCSDVIRDIQWQPVNDRAVFLNRAILVHAKK